jgi:tripartite-type tricarboxylate transporter receptor subunit TctC
MIKIVASLLIFLVSLPSWAWTPQKPIEVYIGYSAGSTNEQVFRKLVEIVSENNPGVRFSIQPKPGADGTIAQNFLNAQLADGYHVSVPSLVSLFVANDIWQKSIKTYEWNSFVNVFVMGETPSAVITAANNIVSTPQDLVSRFRNPDRPINVAISGGTGRIAYEFFMHKTGADRGKIKHIPYQNATQTVIAVANGEVDFSFVPVTAARTAAESGKVKIVALTSNQSLPALPGVPTLSTVLSGFEIYSGWFVTLPGKTDPVIVSWYQREFTKAIQSPRYKQWAESNLIIVNDQRTTPESVKAYGEKLRRELSPATKHILPE